MKRLLVLLCLTACADVAGPDPVAPRFWQPGADLPANPNGPHCDAPLVVWHWIGGDGQTGWFCAAPPWWTAPA